MALLNPVSNAEMEKGSGYVLVDPEHVVPRRFHATVHYVGGKIRRYSGEPPRDRYVGPGRVTGSGGLMVSMYVEVQRGGVPRCLSVEVNPEPPENDPITPTSIRLPLDRLMRIALTDVMREVNPDSDWVSSPGLEEREDFHASYRKGARRARGRRPSPEEVADAYRGGMVNHVGRAKPTTELAAEWGVHRSTASRWVDEARKAGALGPAKHGAATP